MDAASGVSISQLVALMESGMPIPPHLAESVRSLKEAVGHQHAQNATTLAGVQPVMGATGGQGQPLMPNTTTPSLVPITQLATPGADIIKDIVTIDARGCEVREIWDSSGMVTRHEVVDVYVFRPEHPPARPKRGHVAGDPTVKDVSIITPKPERRADVLAAYLNRRIAYAFPASDIKNRKRVQSKRDAEVVRIKKYLLRGFLAELGAARRKVMNGTMAAGTVPPSAQATLVRPSNSGLVGSVPGSIASALLGGKTASSHSRSSAGHGPAHISDAATAVSGMVGAAASAGMGGYLGASSSETPGAAAQLSSAPSQLVRLLDTGSVDGDASSAAAGGSGSGGRSGATAWGFRAQQAQAVPAGTRSNVAMLAQQRGRRGGMSSGSAAAALASSASSSSASSSTRSTNIADSQWTGSSHASTSGHASSGSLGNGSSTQPTASSHMSRQSSVSTGMSATLMQHHQWHSGPSQSMSSSLAQPRLPQPGAMQMPASSAMQMPASSAMQMPASSAMQMPAWPSLAQQQHPYAQHVPLYQQLPHSHQQYMPYRMPSQQQPIQQQQQQYALHTRHPQHQHQHLLNRHDTLGLSSAPVPLMMTHVPAGMHASADGMLAAASGAASTTSSHLLPATSLVPPEALPVLSASAYPRLPSDQRSSSGFGEPSGAAAMHPSNSTQGMARGSGHGSVGHRFQLGGPVSDGSEHDMLHLRNDHEAMHQGMRNGMGLGVVSDDGIGSAFGPLTGQAMGPDSRQMLQASNHSGPRRLSAGAASDQGSSGKSAAGGHSRHTHHLCPPVATQQPAAAIVPPAASRSCNSPAQNVTQQSALEGAGAGAGADLSGLMVAWRPPGDVSTSADASLRLWLFSAEHIVCPYPTLQELEALRVKTGLGARPLERWFAKARPQLWAPLVRSVVAAGASASLSSAAPMVGALAGISAAATGSSKMPVSVSVSTSSSSSSAAEANDASAAAAAAVVAAAAAVTVAASSGAAAALSAVADAGVTDAIHLDETHSSSHQHGTIDEEELAATTRRRRQRRLERGRHAAPDEALGDADAAAQPLRKASMASQLTGTASNTLVEARPQDPSASNTGATAASNTGVSSQAHQVLQHAQEALKASAVSVQAPSSAQAAKASALQDGSVEGNDGSVGRGSGDSIEVMGVSKSGSSDGKRSSQMPSDQTASDESGGRSFGNGGEPICSVDGGRALQAGAEHRAMRVDVVDDGVASDERETNTNSSDGGNSSGPDKTGALDRMPPPARPSMVKAASRNSRADGSAASGAASASASGILGLDNNQQQFDAPRDPTEAGAAQAAAGMRVQGAVSSLTARLLGMSQPRRLRDGSGVAVAVQPNGEGVTVVGATPRVPTTRHGLGAEAYNQLAHRYASEVAGSIGSSDYSWSNNDRPRTGSSSDGKQSRKRHHHHQKHHRDHQKQQSADKTTRSLESSMAGSASEHRQQEQAAAAAATKATHSSSSTSETPQASQLDSGDSNETQSSVSGSTKQSKRPRDATEMSPASSASGASELKTVEALSKRPAPATKLA